jgi:hypothetical protein
MEHTFVELIHERSLCQEWIGIVAAPHVCVDKFLCRFERWDFVGIDSEICLQSLIVKIETRLACVHHRPGIFLLTASQCR